MLMLIMILPTTAFDYFAQNPNNAFVQKINYVMVNTSSVILNLLTLTVGLTFFLMSLMISMCIYNSKEF